MQYNKSLLNPNIFISALKNNLKAIEVIIKAILNIHCPLSVKYPLSISHFDIYISGFKRSDGLPDKSITVYVEDADNNLYDFDLMIADNKHFVKQGRVHSNHLSVHGRYSENDSVQDYILLFTQKTLPGYNIPLAMVAWSIVETNEIWEETDHGEIALSYNIVNNECSSFRDRINKLYIAAEKLYKDKHNLYTRKKA